MRFDQRKGSVAWSCQGEVKSVFTLEEPASAHPVDRGRMETPVVIDLGCEFPNGYAGSSSCRIF